MTQIEAPHEGNNQLLRVSDLRRSVDDLKRISGLSTLRNDVRTAAPAANAAVHPLARFFRLDAVAPSADSNRPQEQIPLFEREQLLKMQKSAVERAQTPNATWDDQMTAAVMQYYPFRERFPDGFPDRDAIETGANMHITRLLTNIYGATEFISTFELYVKYLEDNPSAHVHRNATVENQLVQDARTLSALMPYWGRAIQVCFVTIEKNSIESYLKQLQPIIKQLPVGSPQWQKANKDLQAVSERLKVVNDQLQSAKKFLESARKGAVTVGITLPNDAGNLPIDSLMMTIEPVEKRLRDILFAQPSPIESPRHTPSIIEAMLRNVTDEQQQKALREALAAMNLTEPETKEIRGRRVHAAYLNLLVLHRRSEADGIIKRASNAQIPPEDIQRLFSGHREISRQIMNEHRFGLQTTTAHMFAGTLGISTTLHQTQNPEARLKQFSANETNDVFADFLRLLSETSTNPEMQKGLQEQRVKSAAAVRNYVTYMRQEALTLRVSTQMLDGVYIQPAIQNMSEGIRQLSKSIESLVAGVANWVIWGPVISYYFPSLRFLRFDTSTPAGRKELIQQLEKMRGEAEADLKAVQSLSSTIETARKTLESLQKRQEPHLLIVENMTAEDINDPAKVKMAQAAVKAIAEIDQEIAKTIEDTWVRIEGNMQHHAKTTAILAQAQESWENMAKYIGAAALSMLFHVGYNMYMSGRASTRLGRFFNFSGRMVASVVAGPLYPTTELAIRGVRRLMPQASTAPNVTPTNAVEVRPPVTQQQLRTAATRVNERYAAWRKAWGMPGVDALQETFEQSAIEFRDLLNRYTPSGAGDLSQEALRFRFAQELVGVDIVSPDAPYRVIRQELLRRAHNFGMVAEGIPHSQPVAKSKMLILQGWDPASLSTVNGQPTRRLTLTINNQVVEVATEAAFTPAQANDLLRTGLAGQSAPAAPALSQTSNVSAETAQALVKMRSNVQAMLDLAVEQGALTTREAGLINQSPSARRMFEAASNSEELFEAIRLAKRASVLRATMYGAFGAADLFGAYMAWVRFEELGRDLELAKRTGNTELQALYRGAQIINGVQFGVSVGGFISNGIAIYGALNGVAGGICAVASAAALPLTLLGTGLMLREACNEVAATLLRLPQDWAQKSPMEIIGELNRLSRAEHTLAENFLLGGAGQDILFRGLETLSGGDGGRSREVFRKNWESMQRTAAGVRANLCAGYILQTTRLQQLPNEAPTAYNQRLSEYVTLQLRYLSNLSRGQFDIISARQFTEARIYADLLVRFGELNGRSEMINLGGNRQFDIATIGSLPPRGPDANGVYLSEVIAAMASRQRSQQLVEINTLCDQESNGQAVTSPLDVTRRRQQAQDVLHGMLLTDLQPYIDQQAVIIQRADIGGAEQERQYAQMAGALRTGMREAESRMLVHGMNLNVNQYEQELDTLRSLLLRRDYVRSINAPSVPTLGPSVAAPRQESLSIQDVLRPSRPDIFQDSSLDTVSPHPRLLELTAAMEKRLVALGARPVMTHIGRGERNVATRESKPLSEATALDATNTPAFQMPGSNVYFTIINGVPVWSSRESPVWKPIDRARYVPTGPEDIRATMNTLADELMVMSRGLDPEAQSRIRNAERAAMSLLGAVINIRKAREELDGLQGAREMDQKIGRASYTDTSVADRRITLAEQIIGTSSLRNFSTSAGVSNFCWRENWLEEDGLEVRILAGRVQFRTPGADEYKTWTMATSATQPFKALLDRDARQGALIADRREGLRACQRLVVQLARLNEESGL